MEGAELMEMFEDFSGPPKTIELPSVIKIVPTMDSHRSNQNSERSYSGLDYSFVEKRKMDLQLTKSFAKMNLNMSELTRMTPSIMDFSRSDVNTTFASTSNDVKFASNNHRTDLPIYKYRDEIVHHINESPVAVITGKTGCGKTTQVPQYIYDNWKTESKKKGSEMLGCNILVSQPRKIAAITIAQRVAEERNTKVGGLVGYQVGLKSEINKYDEDSNTRILFCTTGVILQRLIHEKTMSKYSHIIIDEIHERDIDTDFLLIVIRRMFAIDSPKTKIILMSATMDVQHFLNFFTVSTVNGSDFFPPVIDLTLSPRNFKIREYFLEKFENLVDEDLVNYEEPGIIDQMYDFGVRIMNIFCKQMQQAAEFKNFRNGTILVFLPGLNEIETLYNKFEEMLQKSHRAIEDHPLVCILHSSLSSDEQYNALIPGNKPKIILSTNIAESSLTIPNVTHVIDFCLTKFQSVAKGALLSSLVLNWSSKQSSQQRAGRCGRLCDGYVMRMVHENFYKLMNEYSAPEMTRVGLETVILKTKVLGLGSPLKMLALAPDPPDMSTIVDSMLHLKELGGLLRFDRNGTFDYEDGELTFLGRIMEALPVDPRIAKFIVTGYLYSVLEEAIIIGAGLNIKSIFINNFGQKLLNYSQRLSWSHGSGSDCIAILNAYRLWDRQVSTQAPQASKVSWCKRNGLDIRNLSEMTLLIQEIKKRLKNMRIFLLPNQPTWITPEKNFILKVCMAGAFGPSHFFIPAENDHNIEREIFKAVDNHDPFTSVFFRNMDRTLVGDVYEKQLRAALIEKKVIGENTEVKFNFNYQTSEKILLEFVNGQDEDDDEPTTEGKVLPEVYNAVKFRHIDGNITLNVMDNVETMQWAEKHGLGAFDKETGTFGLTKKYVEEPGLCVLPTITTVEMHGTVTHIENANKFFFMPIKAVHKFEGGSAEDKSYGKNIKKIETMLRVTQKEKVDGVVAAEKLLIVKIDGKLYRARFVAVKSPKTWRIKLVDVGKEIIADIDEIFKIEDEYIEAALQKYPSRVFECTLSHISPSFAHSRDGKWTEKSVRVLREHVLNRNASISIFSVVKNVVAVKMVVGETNVNKKMVQKHYANECEENYLSILDHDLRQQLHSRQVPPEEEFALKENISKMPMCPPPAMSQCKKTLRLKGPFSPLEVSLNGVSRFCQSKVNVDQNSVNSVILDDDITNSRSKFYVAADVTVSQNTKLLVLRDVTVMPAMPGLAVILALIFCPTAELRRDKEKSRYVSLLTGLGFDKNTQLPYYGEHDSCFDIDFKIDADDIDSINCLRFLMSSMLRADDGCDFSNLVDGDKIDILHKIQGSILAILSKKRPFRAVDSPMDSFNWNVDQTDINRRTDPIGRTAIFEFHKFPGLFEMSKEAKKELQLHAFELIKATKGTLFFNKKFCRLCSFTWEYLDDLKLHLQSMKHINRVEELMK